MQAFKLLSKAIIFVALNVLVALGLHFVLAQPSVVNVLLNTVRSDSHIDTIVLGQSHTETGVNPYILSEEADCDAINLGRRLVSPENMYYLLESASQTNRIRKVVLDIDPTYWVIPYQGEGGTDNNMLYQEIGIAKVDYLLSECLCKDFPYVLFDYHIEKGTVTRIPKNVQCKLNEAYINREEESIPYTNKVLGLGANFEYKGRGFNYGVNRKLVDSETYSPTQWIISESAMNQKALLALEKIASYCRRNGVELVCMTSALPPIRLQNENYDDAHNYFQELCESYGIEYYDMNYARREYLKCTDADFVDVDGHMMGEMADRQTSFLAMLLKSENTDGYFYDSYEEVIANICNEA